MAQSNAGDNIDMINDPGSFEEVGTAVLWGGETQGDGGPTSLPQTEGSQFTFKPTGNPNYYYWGPSTDYPAGGSSPCQADDATGDSALQGCPDQYAGVPNKQASLWIYKYDDWIYYQNY